MEVLCIDDKKRSGDYPSTPNVVEGCIYNVTCICRGRGADGSLALSFKLAEFDQKYCWDCDRFVALSNISETEIQRNHVLSDPVETGIL